jgi:transposase
MDAVPECAGCRQRDLRIAELEARVLALEGTVRDLLDRLERLQHPKPPRVQEPQPPAPPKKATGRKPGGQPGHPPHLKTLLPAERVTNFVPFVPSRCSRCRAALSPDPGPLDPPPTRHQVVELPPVVALVTEYQGHSRTCPCCGEVTHAPIPAEVRAHSVGPALTAALAYFAGSHGVSKRGIEEIADQLFDAPIALGTVANLEQETSAALAAIHQEAKNAVAAAPVKHVDETGWKENGKKRWFWAAATLRLAVFAIHPLRNSKALRHLLGEAMIGILLSDRWCVYDEWPLDRRQLCWAHVKRNVEKQRDRGGPNSRAAQWAEGFLDLQRRVFEAWHLFRGGGITPRQFDDRIASLMIEASLQLEQGTRSRDKKLARFCARLRQRQIALWTFATPEGLAHGVEPTNNHAERVQRRAVLWRRRSFGCHSADGCRFVERILTVVQSLRLQNRPVLAFLAQAIEAHRCRSKAPTLLVAG